MKNSKPNKMNILKLMIDSFNSNPLFEFFRLAEEESRVISNEGLRVLEEKETIEIR